MAVYTKYLLIFLVVTGLASCLTTTEYPEEPAIEFKEFIQYPDSARLVIKFTDGDGNIGLGQEDTTGIFCPDECLYHWNLFCEYYEMQDGQWTHVEIDWMEGVPFYYRVPKATPTGQNPALVGEISIAMPIYYLSTTGYDTARFQVSLVDRALNESNTVTTTEFIKPN